MKSLIIGAGGFVGGYLIDELLKGGQTVYVTKLPHEKICQAVETFDLDITDYTQVEKLLDNIRPERIYHLAAQSSVKLSWEKPQLTTNINVLGAVNLFEAIRKVCPDAKVVIIGSSEEYGTIDYTGAVKETDIPEPGNIYALSKLCQEQLAKIYVKAYGLHIVATRSFNHIGAKQSPQFVVADFCNQVARAEKGLQPPVIKVGNLSAKRDFTDVKDVVKAYTLLAEKGADGEVYNVGSGKAVEIKEILNKIISFSKTDIKVEADKEKFRPVDVPVIKADISKIKALGWQPAIDIGDSICSVLEYFRGLY